MLLHLRLLMDANGRLVNNDCILMLFCKALVNEAALPLPATR